MAYCGNCGSQLQDGLRFCQSCGKEVDATAGQQPPPQQQQQQQHWYAPPTDPQWQPDARDVRENKAMAIVAYILFFVPLLAGTHKASPFVKYHTNQGTVLFIASAIYGTAYSILVTILFFIPILGLLVTGVLGFAGIVFLVLCILGIVNAANGIIKPLPIIGGITIIK